jgi:hypothetical protein
MDTFLLLERLAWYGTVVKVHVLQNSLKKSNLLASLANFKPSYMLLNSLGLDFSVTTLKTLV